MNTLSVFPGLLCVLLVLHPAQADDPVTGDPVADDPVADGTDANAAADLVAGMLKGAKASLALEPIRPQDVPEAERAAYIAAYKKEMKAFADMLGKLETALREGRSADATKLVADIGAHQRASRPRTPSTDSRCCASSR